MATHNCNSCEELRQTSPEFVLDGLTDEMCTSLQNNTGISPSSGNDDCEDLHNINDCLIGNTATEVNSYENCDWKKFMKMFIPNVWTTFKAVICSICGIWNNIRSIQELIDRLNCLVAYMVTGYEFKFTETSDDTTSYLVAGKGVSFSNVSASGTAGDINITYIAGGVATIGGSVLLYTSDFTDRISSYNYDNNGVNPTKSTSRDGNAIWNDTNTKPGGYTSELVYEIRILKTEYPQIKRFFSNTGLNMDGGAYHVEFFRFAEGEYAYGQHGRCDTDDGDPVHSGDSRGHLVPDNWEYIQCRVTWIERLSGDADGSQVSPRGFIGIRMNPQGIECD